VNKTFGGKRRNNWIAGKNPGKQIFHSWEAEYRLGEGENRGSYTTAVFSGRKKKKGGGRECPGGADITRKRIHEGKRRSGV